MKDLQYVQETQVLASRARAAKAEDKPRTGQARRWVVWSVVLVLWSSLIAGAYFLAQNYINALHQQLVTIQETADGLKGNLNELSLQLTAQRENIELLQERFVDVQGELAAVKEEMSLAGDTLNSTDETKKALGQRITDLSKELENLRKSIKKLEEAARVY